MTPNEGALKFLWLNQPFGKIPTHFRICNVFIKLVFTWNMYNKIFAVFWEIIEVRRCTSAHWKGLNVQNHLWFNIFLNFFTIFSRISNFNIFQKKQVFIFSLIFYRLQSKGLPTLYQNFVKELFVWERNSFLKICIKM